MCVCSVVQLCPTLSDPMDCSPPGSSVQGIFQARYWSGLPFPSSGDRPNPGIKPESTVSPALQADSLLLSHQGSPKLIFLLQHYVYVDFPWLWPFLLFLLKWGNFFYRLQRKSSSVIWKVCYTSWLTKSLSYPKHLNWISIYYCK